VSEENARNRRKVREGVVSSDGMEKTVTVRVSERKVHPLYGKTITRSTKLHVHDENNEARVGDRVQITETRPLSKKKRWRLLEILERAK